MFKRREKSESCINRLADTNQLAETWQGGTAASHRLTCTSASVV